MDEGVLLEASDRVRRNSLVLRHVAEAIKVPQDRLAEVEVASVDEGRGEGGGEVGSECLFEVHHYHLGSQDGAVGSKGNWKASRYMAESLWVRSM